jgi:signal peptide peptidase SppA
MHHASAWGTLLGGISYEEIRGAVHAVLADDTIGHLVLDIDSPGGTVAGLPETAALIREARKVKPITAHINTMAASAAYYLASQASDVIITPSGEAGSIGVWTMHQNISKMLEDSGIDITLIFAGSHKIDGHPFGPLTEDVHESMQADVDAFMQMFIDDVAHGRGVSASVVRKTFGDGKLLLAKEALAVGMVDSIQSFAGAAGNSKARSNMRRRRAEIMRFI